jgi:hypothetical protein
VQNLLLIFFLCHVMAFFYYLVPSYWFSLVLIVLSSSFSQIFRVLMGINVRVLLILLLLGIGLIFYIGARTSPIIVFVFSICIISFLFSIYLTKWVLAKDEGPPEMVQVHLFSISFAHDGICLFVFIFSQ